MIQRHLKPPVVFGMMRAGFLVVMIFAGTACPSKAGLSINDFSASAPTKALTGIYTEVQFNADVSMAIDCGYCDESASGSLTYSPSVRLIDSPAGAAVSYYLHNLEAQENEYVYEWDDERFEKVRTFFFKTDLPGEYTFEVSLSGTLSAYGKTTTATETETLTIVVEENHLENILSVGDETEPRQDGMGDLIGTWYASRDAVQGSANIISAEEETDIVISPTTAIDGDDSTSLLTMSINDQTYVIPFMFMRHVVSTDLELPGFGQLLFLDSGDDGIEETYFTPMLDATSSSAYYNSDEAMFLLQIPE